ncbi:SelT/SelW/SelH family protein [Cellulomonas sp. S1-8]|uniref:SelT/SelW/SelH family protein n=1 Tax=Cellulomonas sp. S1-8 TaxID=2904790 RepID=UPI002244CEE3|nr:SelT/SelW/SelH family protein [Cellulomonas sp. S1-8]UZN04611.1 SelT/SelW/SelH family protein [Cellulomonas sp. S1-8]
MSADVPHPRVTITYCTQCRWLLRAAWFAQELLTTFHRELAEVALRPATGGVFTVEVDGEMIWDRAERRGFPEITTLKQLVRDRVAPGKPLGHSDAGAAAGDAGAQAVPVDAPDA